MNQIQISIGGRREHADGRATSEIVSPSTGETLATMAHATPHDIDRAVAAAAEASAALEAYPPRERGTLLRAVTDRLTARSERVAEDLAAEQGKPLAEARDEVAVAVEMWRDAAEVIRHRTDEILPSDLPGRQVVVTRRPHGVLAAVTPWNFPAAIPTEYLCAGLAAANGIVWKPSELTTMTAQHLLECIEEAGLPDGAVNLVPGFGADVGARLVGHAGVDAVGFTGSPVTGQEVARAAAAKPCLLELGGNNATVVLDDVNVAQVIPSLAMACFANAGQICSSTERVIVHRSILDDVADGLVEAARSLRLGPSLDPDTTIGPLNNEPTASKVDRHIGDAVTKGAKVLTGGGREDGWPTNLYYQPTVLSGLQPEMVGFREETFGPVAALVPFDDDDEAARLVNGHDLGLIAGVLGSDPERTMAIARQLEVGIVNVGDVATEWQPHTPFGGWSGRRSGTGRLGGRYTIEALSQLQTYVVPSGRTA